MIFSRISIIKGVVKVYQKLIKMIQSEWNRNFWSKTLYSKKANQNLKLIFGMPSCFKNWFLWKNRDIEVFLWTTMIWKKGTFIIWKNVFAIKSSRSFKFVYFCFVWNFLMKERINSYAYTKFLDENLTFWYVW